MSEVAKTSKREEIERNYQYFEKILPEIEDEHQGDYVLLRQESIVAFFTTIVEAQIKALKLFNDGIYSIQQVGQEPIELGFYSHAIDNR